MGLWAAEFRISGPLPDPICRPAQCQTRPEPAAVRLVKPVHVGTTDMLHVADEDEVQRIEAALHREG